MDKIAERMDQMLGVLVKERTERVYICIPPFVPTDFRSRACSPDPVSEMQQSAPKLPSEPDPSGRVETPSRKDSVESEPPGKEIVSLPPVDPRKDL